MAIYISCEVGTALLALLSTALTCSGTSKQARTSHSSTERGITSAVWETRIWASVAEDSRFAVSFRGRTELKKCLRAG